MLTTNSSHLLWSWSKNSSFCMDNLYNSQYSTGFVPPWLQSLITHFGWKSVRLPFLSILEVSYTLAPKPIMHFGWKSVRLTIHQSAVRPLQHRLCPCKYCFFPETRGNSRCWNYISHMTYRFISIIAALKFITTSSVHCCCTSKVPAPRGRFFPRAHSS